MKSIGIYKITNILNNKIYIGSSVNLNKRWYQHYHLLENNKHNNYHLQRAWNKYGKENFVYEIIKLCKEINLENIETFLIRKYKTYDRRIGYNIKDGARSTSEETRKMMSIRTKGNPVYIESMRKAVAKKQESLPRIGKYTMDGNLLEIFKNCKEAQKVLNLDSRRFYEMLNEKHFRKNYRLRIIDENNSIKSIEPYIKPKRTKILKIKVLALKGINIYKEYVSKTQVMKEFNIHRNTVDSWINNTTKLERLTKIGNLYYI